MQLQEKTTVFNHLNVFQLQKSGLLLAFSLHVDIIIFVWSLSMSGSGPPAKKRSIYLNFLLPSSVMQRGDNKLIKS